MVVTHTHTSSLLVNKCQYSEKKNGKGTSLGSRASFVADGSYGSGGGSNPYNYLVVNKH